MLAWGWSLSSLWGIWNKLLRLEFIQFSSVTHSVWHHIDAVTSLSQHEWDKHGKCAVSTGVFADQESYFSAALTKVVRYNPFQVSVALLVAISFDMCAVLVRTLEMKDISIFMRTFIWDQARFFPVSFRHYNVFNWVKKIISQFNVSAWRESTLDKKVSGYKEYVRYIEGIIHSLSSSQNA